jgi:hypothetical protein
MPVTPAHAALALPLSRAIPALPLAPLVIGTLSPDFEYLLRLSPTGRFAHSLVGLVVFCVPVSLLAWAMWCAIMRPALARLLPSGMAATMSERGRGASVAALAGLGALAAHLGAFSHVTWDAFTHANGCAVAHLPVLREEASLGWPLGVRWYRVLQHASSVVGMTVVVAWGASWVASVPRPPGYSPRIRPLEASAWRWRCWESPPAQEPSMRCAPRPTSSRRCWDSRRSEPWRGWCWRPSCTVSLPGLGDADEPGWSGVSVAAGNQRDVDEGEESVEGEEGARHGQHQAEAEDRAGARENGHGRHHDGDL